MWQSIAKQLVCAVLVSAAILSAHASDFAVEVVEYVSGSNPIKPFTNAVNALGRPAIDASGDGLEHHGRIVPISETCPVTPCWPPLIVQAMYVLSGELLVSIGSGGRLVLKFDHPVDDDPLNPYGLDFTVFGNAFQYYDQDNSVWYNRDPSNSIMLSSVGEECGLVSVSQDGTNWYSFTNGPYADSFAPTLGRVYDTENPDTSIGAWNEWWGAPTDPTRPTDPVISATDFSGENLATMCRCYGQSAGGTSFDLADLPNLPVNPANGLKWFQYIKIEHNDDGSPEIDAVADVAPATPYERWTIDTFTWWQMADPAIGGDDGDPSGIGRPNLLNYALAHDPFDLDAPPDFSRIAMTSLQGTHYMRLEYARRTNAMDVTVAVERNTNLMSTAWTTSGIQQAWQVLPTGDGKETVNALVPTDDGQPQFVRLRAER